MCWLPEISEARPAALEAFQAILRELESADDAE